MNAPISAQSQTAKYALPFLFSGQAQKEFFVNEALAKIDALIQLSVVGAANEPPTDVTDGDNFRISSPATGDWAGKEDQIAQRIGGSWHYITPETGMSIFDRSEGTRFYYQEGWARASETTIPTNGAVIDTEARAAIESLIQALRIAGIFPSQQI